MHRISPIVNYRVDNLFSLLSKIIGINDDWRLQADRNIVCAFVHIVRTSYAGSSDGINGRSLGPPRSISSKRTRSHNGHEELFFVISCHSSDLRFIAINQTHSITVSESGCLINETSAEKISNCYSSHDLLHYIVKIVRSNSLFFFIICSEMETSTTQFTLRPGKQQSTAKNAVRTCVLLLLLLVLFVSLIFSWMNNIVGRMEF